MAVTKGEKKHDQGETMRSVIVSSGNSKRLGMITHLLVVMASCWLTVINLAAEDKLTGADLLKRDTKFLASKEGQALIDNLLTYQTSVGGWCKAYNAQQPRETQAGAASYGGWKGTPTIDNGATYSEIALLARAAQATNRDDYRLAAQRGIDFLLSRQYANGGWPQRSPLESGDHEYGTHITFNDDAMTEVLNLFLTIMDPMHTEYSFVTADCRQRIMDATARGVACLLKCQIVIEGQLTVWCQQHDAVTLLPVTARAYELPALCSSESAGITMLLMSLPSPDNATRQAIVAAHQWFQKNKIQGKLWPEKKEGSDRRLIDDVHAPLLWSRYTDLANGRPFFCDRNGIPVWSVNDISAERRNGYAWYGTWGEKVLKSFPAWEKRTANSQ